jgi:hypothetical protein
LASVKVLKTLYLPLPTQKVKANPLQNTDLDIRAYLSTVLDKLKNPAERRPKQEESQTETPPPEALDIDEADYQPNAGKTVLIGGDDDANSNALTAQRETILKEISAFRERSNRRERKFDIADLEKWDNKVESEDSPAVRQGSETPRRAVKEEKKAGAIPSGPAAERRGRGRDIRFRAASDRYDLEDEENIPDDQIESRRLEKKQRDLEAAFREVPPSHCPHRPLGSRRELTHGRERESGYHARKCGLRPWNEK